MSQKRYRRVAFACVATVLMAGSNSLDVESLCWMPETGGKDLARH